MQNPTDPATVDTLSTGTMQSLMAGPTEPAHGKRLSIVVAMRLDPESAARYGAANLAGRAQQRTGADGAVYRYPSTVASEIIIRPGFVRQQLRVM